MYKFTSRIRYSETDVMEKLKPEAVIDYFQDCSSFQSEDLGVGFDFMRAHHVAWIVNYWQIDFLRRPSFGEVVRIGTSPYGFKGFIGLRNFLMETAEGEPLVIANSVWSLFDLEKGVPVRVLPEMVQAYELFPKFDMEYLPRKIRIPEKTDGAPDAGGSAGVGGSASAGAGAGAASDAGGSAGAGTTPDAGGSADTGSFARSFRAIPVTEDMLDSNHHMNNGQYVRIAMSVAGEGTSDDGASGDGVPCDEACGDRNIDDGVPCDEACGDRNFDDGDIHRLRVEYLAQAHLGDLLRPVVYRKAGASPERDGVIVSLASAAAGKPYAVVEIS